MHSLFTHSFHSINHCLTRSTSLLGMFSTQVNRWDNVTHDNQPSSMAKGGISTSTQHLSDQRRRRLSDIVQMLYKCFVLAGLILPGSISPPSRLCLFRFFHAATLPKPLSQPNWQSLAARAPRHESWAIHRRSFPFYNRSHQISQPFYRYCCFFCYAPINQPLSCWIGYLFRHLKLELLMPWISSFKWRKTFMFM